MCASLVSGFGNVIMFGILKEGHHTPFIFVLWLVNLAGIFGILFS